MALGDETPAFDATVNPILRNFASSFASPKANCVALAIGSPELTSIGTVSCSGPLAAGVAIAAVAVGTASEASAVASDSVCEPSASRLVGAEFEQADANSIAAALRTN